MKTIFTIWIIILIIGFFRGNSMIGGGLVNGVLAEFSFSAFKI